MLAQDTHTATGVDAAEVASNLDAVFNDTVISAEFAASNGVFWTPTYFLNGAMDWEMNKFTSVSDWINYFNNFN